MLLFVVVCWLPKFHGFKLALLFYKIKVRGKFCSCCVRFRYSSGSPELPQVCWLVRLLLRRLRVGLRTHTSVLLYSDTIHRPVDISMRLGRTDASRQNSTTTNARSMSYRSIGVMLYQALCGVCAALEQLVASLCAAYEGKSDSGTYHSITEGYTRRYSYIPRDLLYCGGCTWTKISRQPIL